MKQNVPIEDINNQLESIEKRIHLIQESHNTWKYLVMEHEKRQEVVVIYNIYLEFFSIIEASLFTTIITKISTLFDTDKRSISFPNILRKMKQNKVNVTITSINYDKFLKKGRRIWNYRCKDIAHIDEASLITDFLKQANFTYDKFDEFIIDCRKLTNELFTFQNKSISQYISENSGIETLISDLTKEDL